MGLFRSVDISFDVYTEKLITGIDRLHDIWPGDIHKPYTCGVDSVDDKIDPTLICRPVLVYHNIFNFLHTVHLC